MKKLGVFLLALILALGCVCAVPAETEERIIPKYDEIVIAVGKRMLTRYSTTTGPMKAAGVSYSVSDENIATVNRQGYVLGVAPGECVLTLTSKRNADVTATIRVKVVVELKKIQLSVPTTTLGVGEQVPVSYTLQPETVKDAVILFSSNKESVATVDADGMITAVGRGQATIVATSEDGRVKASVRVKVEQKPEEVLFASESYMLSIGKKRKLKVMVEPSNAKNKNVVWSSSDESIAKVDRRGNVTAISVGDAVITATSEVAPDVSGSVVIRCVRPAESVTVDRVQYDLQSGESAQIHATVLPEDTTVKDVEYLVLNRDICRVDANGVITPLRSGKTTVQVVTVDGSRRTASVLVRCIVPPESLRFDQLAARVGAGTHGFTQVSVLPCGATPTADIDWVSSDESVATVSGTTNRVRIEGHKWGSCVITATTRIGQYQASLPIYVGNMYEAIGIQDAKIRDGQLSVTVLNRSNLHMTSVSLRLVSDKARPQDAVMDGLDLAPGATCELSFALESASLRRGEVAVSAWETDTGYSTLAGETRNSYRIAAGLMDWHEAR